MINKVVYNNIKNKIKKGKNEKISIDDIRKSLIKFIKWM